MAATIDVARASLEVPTSARKTVGSGRKAEVRVVFSTPEPDGADVGVELRCPPRLVDALDSVVKTAVHAGLARAGVAIPVGGFHVLVEVTVPAAGSRVDGAVVPFVETFVAGAVAALLLRTPRVRAGTRTKSAPA